jgi:hypothetical protein
MESFCHTIRPDSSIMTDWSGQVDLLFETSVRSGDDGAVVGRLE